MTNKRKRTPFRWGGVLLFWGVNWGSGKPLLLRFWAEFKFGFVVPINSNLPPAALHREEEEEAAWKGALCEAVETMAKEAESLPLRVSYAEMTERFGEDVFGGKQPKRALEVVREELREKGVRVETGVSVRKDKKVAKGVTIMATIHE